MIEDLARRLRFVLERWVQRGVLPQLLLMAALIVLVALAGGVAAWALTDEFAHLPAAIWWSFLRLTDPGYLGDDQGGVLRTVSTAITVLGYVLFMGSLIAIMSQWLAATLRKLESGLTPIAMQDHFVILGWTNRTPETIRKLLTARGRLERFLAARDAAHLRVVVLADHVDAARRLELREDLGDVWREHQIFLRSGSSLQREALERLDILRAAAVIVPGADFELGGAELSDTRVVKTLLTLDALLSAREGDAVPQVVAEIFDPRRLPIARSSLTTPVELIASDRLVSRLLSQSLRHPGVAPVLLQLLTHREGNALYLRSFAELEGASPGALASAFPRALVLGAVSVAGGAPVVHLDPATEHRLAADDLLVLLAESHDDAAPDPEALGSLRAGDHAPVEPARQPAAPAPAPDAAPGSRPRRRLLVLGWSHKIPTLLAELQESTSERFDVVLFSRIDVDERERALAHIALDPDWVHVEHAQGDYSLEHDLGRIQPASFDQVLFLASSWMSSSEEADARTILGFLLLRALLPPSGPHPDVLVEFLDPENDQILGASPQVVFVSPRILSHLLAHVALRPELGAVFDALICAGGAELVLRRPAELDLAAGELRFVDVQQAAAARGTVALGLLRARPSGPPDVQLNPPRDTPVTLADDDRLVLLARA